MTSKSENAIATNERIDTKHTDKQKEAEESRKMREKEKCIINMLHHRTSTLRPASKAAFALCIVQKSRSLTKLSPPMLARTSHSVFIIISSLQRILGPSYTMRHRLLVTICSAEQPQPAGKFFLFFPPLRARGLLPSRAVILLILYLR